MPIKITIRNVPQAVRDKLADRAKLEGKSMQEFLRGELLKISQRPLNEAWISAVQQRKALYGTRLKQNSERAKS